MPDVSLHPTAATVAELVAELDRAKATILAQHDRIRDLEERGHDPQAHAYRIALRPDHDGYLDDVVVHDVPMFRMEDMGDWWWLCCYLDGTSPDRIAWSLSVDDSGRIVATVTETPVTAVTYEVGASPDDVTHPAPTPDPQEAPQ